MNVQSNKSGQNTGITSVVCTLFEGDYHYGVGALVNSLQSSGFQGCVWAGYKGALPPWAQTDSTGKMIIADGISIRFVPLTTDWHLTNYKPTFMRELWEREGADWEALFYFDPDIVITCPWVFYEKWVSHGVCLVQEITNTNMPENHPIRLEWAQLLQDNHKNSVRHLNQYFSGGFIGVNRHTRDFLSIWQEVLMSVFTATAKSPSASMAGGRWDAFFGIDQDALNIACMASDCPLSTIGPEGMGFVPGGFTMQHAIGSPKPWRFCFWRACIGGMPPGTAIKAYWNYVQRPITLYSSFRFFFMRFLLLVSTLVGRFYAKN